MKVFCIGALSFVEVLMEPGPGFLPGRQVSRPSDLETCLPGSPTGSMARCVAMELRASFLFIENFWFCS